MSDLKPTGEPLVLEGVEYHLLFTLNAIEEIQEHFNAPLVDVINRLTDKNTSEATLKYILVALINDEIERLNYHQKDGGGLEPVDERQMGWMLTHQNVFEATVAVLRAYGCDLPKSEDDDPNQKGGRQKK